tara:strand:- start:3262 stop:3453 length:192 start_codon:yes stop_codon:yes gene_type:complete
MKRKTIYWIVGIVIIISMYIFCNMDSGKMGGAPEKMGCKRDSQDTDLPFKFKFCKLFIFTKCY